MKWANQISKQVAGERGKIRESKPRLATLLTSNWLTKWHEIFRPIAIRGDALIIGSITSRCSGKWARTHPPEFQWHRRRVNYQFSNCVTDKVNGSRVQPSLFGEDQRPDPGDGGNRAYSYKKYHAPYLIPWLGPDLALYQDPYCTSGIR